ncbi:MAG: hypothetical protein AB4290_05335, partial [Spirulina sp.]
FFIGYLRIALVSNMLFSCLDSISVCHSLRSHSLKMRSLPHDRGKSLTSELADRFGLDWANAIAEGIVTEVELRQIGQTRQGRTSNVSSG